LQEVSKTKERLELGDIIWLLPFKDCLDLGGVRFDAMVKDELPKEVELFGVD
jgi:hypothetical protein